MIQLFAIGFFGVWIPGPDMLLVLRTSIVSGKPAALKVLLGILTGNFLYLLPVLLGYSMILESLVPFFFLFGGMYLIFLSAGFRKLSRSELPVDNREEHNLYRKGLLTNLSNPKAMVYFSSVLLPALLAKSQLFLSFAVFFSGVISAFLMIILLGEKVRHIFSRYSRVLGYVFFVVFFLYGISNMIQGITILANHTFQISEKDGRL